MRRRFATLDVFTKSRFTGNPLAVVLEADGLEKADMQAIAREFNLPETVFMLPPANANNRALLRIFTPKAELPFAGHPTVGTAVLLGCMSGYNRGEHEMVLEETIGPVHCMVDAHGREHGYASFILPRLPERQQARFDHAAIADALGLNPDDIGCGEFVPSLWSAGVPVNFVPLRDLDAMARARPDQSYFDAAFGGGSSPAYLFCDQVSEAGHHFHARMFAPRLGITEDPATGSAAAAFAGVLAQSGALEDGAHQLVIEQGYEMGRPSQIELSMTIREGVLSHAAIGGSAIIVSDGHIDA